MNIVLNGESTHFDEAATLSTVITYLQLGGQRFAIEVNEEIIPRSRHGDYRLQAGDTVEVVQAIGGG